MKEKSSETKFGTERLSQKTIKELKLIRLAKNNIAALLGSKLRV